MNSRLHKLVAHLAIISILAVVAYNFSPYLEQPVKAAARQPGNITDTIAIVGKDTLFSFKDGSTGYKADTVAP